MKKMLIVFGDAKVGGIQKALISFLKEVGKKEDVTLMLFYKGGKLLQEIPSNIRVMEIDSDFRYMGMSQSDCKTIKDKLKRGIYAFICKVAGKKAVIQLISRTATGISTEEYDEVISYNHVVYMHSLYGGVPQYVLGLKNAKKKTCFIHCDYLHSGTRNDYSEYIYKQFDEIICVSESTKRLFLDAIPEMEGKVKAQYNPIDEDEIKNKSRIEPYVYDPLYINCITVARLGKEKGITRVIHALKNLNEKSIRYYIVGEGKERKFIEGMINEYGLSENVTLLGEQENPYRYMKNADFMIVPSYQEAAPVVFQEAIVLGLPILATRTSSADEMISSENGLVIDNDDAEIEAVLKKIINNPGLIIKRKMA